MIELPTEKVKAQRVNPKSVILFGKPKIGKSTAVANLENALILDLEGGTDFLDALKIDIKGEALKQDIEPIVALKQVINSIKDANKAKGGYVYNYGVIDTVSALEDMVGSLACRLYKQTSIGKNWQGTDVLTLAQGAGYHYLRQALWLVINELEECFDTLIILGHLKDKLVEKEGKEMTERGLDLIGKSAAILSANVDAIGYMYREDNKTVVNFQPSETVTCGSRCEHLKNKKIALIESDESGKLTINWNEIFI